MKEETISVSELKATCLKVVEKVKNTGMSITITKNGKPAARLTPSTEVTTNKYPLFGSLSDQVLEVGDITSPLDIGDWEVFK